MAEHFLNDMDKMDDFFNISKEEFLTSYDYLTEEDYMETQLALHEGDLVSNIADLFRQAENMYIDELNDRDTGWLVTSEQLKSTLARYVELYFTKEMKQELQEVCNSMGI